MGDRQDAHHYGCVGGRPGARVGGTTVRRVPRPSRAADATACTTGVAGATRTAGAAGDTAGHDAGEDADTTNSVVAAGGDSAAIYITALATATRNRKSPGR